MLKFILILLLFDLHTSEGVRVLSGTPSTSNVTNTDTTNQDEEEDMIQYEGLSLAVESGINVTDFTLCFRVYEHIYANEIIK